MPNPDPVMAVLHAVGQAMARGDRKAATLQLENAWAAHPTDPRLHLMAARLAEASQQPEQALAHTRRAAALAPQWEAPATELALLLARLGKPLEALDVARRAVALAPDSLDVLYRVVDIAHQALNPQLALDWLQHAATLDPDNPELLPLIARDLTQLGRYAEAMAAYTTLLARQPEHTEFRLARAKVAVYAGDLAAARQDGEMLVAQEPGNETHRFWLAVARGETPPTQPLAMTQAMFDGYAPLFDQHLVQGLQYRVPEQVAAWIAQQHPQRALGVLDLGCGTGLLGQRLGGGQGRLVGVDLAPNMVAQAERLGLYDTLHVAELVAFLRGTPTPFDVVAACDVFIYLGDPGQAIALAWHWLRPGGHLVFSCEAAGEHEADLVLRPSTRYAHKAGHVRALCEAAGFEAVTLTPTPIRVEDGQPIAGYLLSARRPG